MATRLDSKTSDELGVESQRVLVSFDDAVKDIEAQPLDGRVCLGSKAWDGDLRCWRVDVEITHDDGALTEYAFYGEEADRAEAVLNI